MNSFNNSLIQMDIIGGVVFVKGKFGDMPGRVFFREESPLYK